MLSCFQGKRKHRTCCYQRTRSEANPPLGKGICVCRVTTRESRHTHTANREKIVHSFLIHFAHHLVLPRMSANQDKKDKTTIHRCLFGFVNSLHSHRRVKNFHRQRGKTRPTLCLNIIPNTSLRGVTFRKWKPKVGRVRFNSAAVPQTQHTK